MKDELILQAYAIPFKLVIKNNWGTHQKWWGKMEPVSSSCRKYVALEHGTYLHSCRVGDISSCLLIASVGLGNPF